MILKRKKFIIYSYLLTPQVGFEPTTNRLTADRSTTELLKISNYFFSTFFEFIKKINSLSTLTFISILFYKWKIF